MPQSFGRRRSAGARTPTERPGPDVLAAAHDVLVDAPDLRRLDEALGWMARELVARFGFDRVMVLRPADDLLTLAGIAFSQEPDLAEQARANAEHHPVRLRHHSLETEMMRRRAPALVTPAGDPRAWHPITDQLQTPSYVAAPVEAFGRTVATLHADAHFAGREVGIHDRSAIGVFAQTCTGVLERALLFEEIERLRAGARTAAEQILTLAGPEPAAPDPAPTPPSPRSRATHPALTPREAEVLALMSRGATSQEIARRLVVSAGTVKTHARNILEKLGASTRAEAVARALALQNRSDDGG